MSETKDKQQGRILPREDFHLLQFKLTKEGVFVKHHLGGTNPKVQTNDCEYRPHPDLKEVCDELRLYMATRLGFLEGWDFSREHTRKDRDVLEKAIQGHKDVVERMNVNGITFKGEGETYGVSITGSFKTPKNGSVGVSVPKISFEKEELGYEEDVEAICEKVTDEIYAYLILNKKAQTNIEDQAEGFDNNGNQTSLEDDFNKDGERKFISSEEQLKAGESKTESDLNEEGKK